MNKHIRTLFFGLSVAGIAVAGTPRLALAAADGLPTRTVSYADLDLAKPSGAKTLYQRISIAAQQVCIIMPGLKDLSERAAEQACMEKAVDAAVRQVQSAALNDLHGKLAIRVARN